MGLISETVKVIWSRRNKRHFENKGYIYCGIGNEFEVKVKDLSDGSHVEVEIECDCKDCKNPKKIIKWKNYLKCVTDSKYYCTKCVKKMYSTKKIVEAKLINGKSFYQWCIDNNRQDILDRWDYELNKCEPSEICFRTNMRYYFKCPRGLHKSELKNINRFSGGSNSTMDCNYCDSFAQKGIDSICNDFLEKYWDYVKNNKIGIDPWEISYGSGKGIYIKCQEKDYHGSYFTSCSGFNSDNRCSYCSNTKVHPLDSLGKLLEDKILLNLWSDKNKKSPYEYAPRSHTEVYWKCPNKKHKDYKRSINNSNKYNFRCPSCEFSEGEYRIDHVLTEKCVDYITQKTFEGLVGLGGGLLSYDFYLLKYNLLIEYQGEFHDGTANIQTEEDFERQVEHDRRKKEYAEEKEYNFLEIWYKDFENIEEILTKELNLLEEVLLMV